MKRKYEGTGVLTLISLPGKIIQNMSKIGTKNPLSYWMRLIKWLWIFEGIRISFT